MLGTLLLVAATPADRSGEGLPPAVVVVLVVVIALTLLIRTRSRRWPEPNDRDQQRRSERQHHASPR
jgi:membrane protein implicated in regulation of membrane protease activity